jgi:hypothetical protein
LLWAHLEMLLSQWLPNSGTCAQCESFLGTIVKQEALTDH